MEYYTELIHRHKNNQSALFKTTKSLFGENSTTPLPPWDNHAKLANAFSDFFINKVANIRSNLDQLDLPESVSDSHTENTCTVSTSFCVFRQITLEEVSKVITSAKTKSCQLDPVPARLVQQCSHELSPTLVNIINGSLKEGVFPTLWKRALITPILKKKGLDTSFSNYRPVSNLQFVSKVLEKVVAEQLSSYLVSSNLLEPHQSAYRPGCSVETALLKVKSDILHHLDDRRCVLLLLLDLSAAFDTVDHHLLL